MLTKLQCVRVCINIFLIAGRLEYAWRFRFHWVNIRWNLQKIRTEIEHIALQQNTYPLQVYIKLNSQFITSHMEIMHYHHLKRFCRCTITVPTEETFWSFILFLCSISHGFISVSMVI